jgi:ATP/maltotriose-dependent transcriptional regulator MalT/DNA-binding SARP family transcriptional activator
VPKRRADVIRRPRLNSFLDSSVGTRGSLIAAPAGYGKTTLVVDWLQTSDFASIWLSLDPWDAELPAFARTLSTAVSRRLDTDVPLGDERFWQPRSVGTVLVNAIAAYDDYAVLVLDDVHTVEASEDVMATIGLILERAPENLHIVMTSRTRPAIPSLSRLVARREVAVLGAADLAFTPREIRELLGTLGRAVSEDEADALFERTEGWAAALILGGASPSASLSGQRQRAGAEQGPAPGANLSLGDYVHGEALDTVPETLRGFLREIALLPVWTPALCNALTGRRDAERLLKELASRVLFITQHAEEPPMYRCHQLMRALLMQALRADDPQKYAELGRAAADTLARFGLLNESVELLFELEAWDEAATLLEEIAPRLLQQGQAHGLAEWIDRLPLAARSERARLLLWRGRAAYKLRNSDEALRLVDESMRLLRREGDTEGLVQASFVKGEALRMKGEYGDALKAFGQASDLIEETGEHSASLQGHAARHMGVTHALLGELDIAVGELEEARRLLEQVGDLEGLGSACDTLAQCYSRRGQPMDALGALQRAQSAFERAGNTYDLGTNLNNTGMVYYELGEYEQALRVYDRGLRLVRGVGNTMEEAFIKAGIAETYRMMGRFDESLAMYEEARPLAEALQAPYLLVALTEGMALTRLGLGHGEEATQLARSVEPAANEAPDRVAQHTLVEAQIALQRGDGTAALRFLDRATPILEEARNLHDLAVASFLRAHALYVSHQPRKAMVELERAADICQRLGYWRFLLPYAKAASEMVEYARVRHVAESILAEIAGPAPEVAKTRSEASTPAMLPRVRALCFGRGSVFVGERQVSDIEWRSEKSKEMFFFLLARKEPVSKEEIFAALWPDLPASKCNSNFHSSLYRLRRALFHECVVRGNDGAYALNPRGIFEADVDVFNRAMAAADASRDAESRAEKLEEAVNAYKGPFMSAIYSEWVEPLRRELEDRYIEALNELGAWKLNQGNFEEALALFKSLDGVDPYSEAAAHGVMRCHLAMNDGVSAARHYRRYRQLLKDELDEEPSERLAELYRRATTKGS